MKRRHSKVSLDGKSKIMVKEPLVRACIKRYGWNIVDKHELSEEFLRFIFDLLPIRKRMAFVRRATKENIENSSEGEDAVSSVLARHCIIDASIHGRCEFNPHKFARELAEIHRVTTPPVPIDMLIQRNKRLKELKQVLKLEDEEIDFICLLYCIKEYEPFQDLCRTHGLPGFVRLCSSALEIPVTRVKRLIGTGGPLISNGVVEERVSGGELPELEDEIVDYMAGIGKLSLVDRYCRKDKGSTLDPETFNIEEDSVEIIRSLLASDKPCNILLYGSPGTGKTEFARAIAAELNKTAYFVRCNEQNNRRGREDEDRRLPLRAAVSAVADKKDVLIVDEADSLLNTAAPLFVYRRSPDKGWLNDFLDQSPSKAIWITNQRAGIEESTMRRFSYSLPFKKFTKRERSVVWHRLLKKHPLRTHIPRGVVAELAATYQVNAGGIAMSLEALKTVVRPDTATPERTRSTLKELLKRHAQAIGQHHRKPLNELTDGYDVSAVNLDVDSGKVIDSVRSFIEHRTNHPDAGGNLDLLFWGRPGTGKTEFAKYLANEAGMELLSRRSSDLMSCWVGENEKNIRDAFDEAERGESVLFIDEADSFLTNRENAVRSWEVSMTNEFLTQMENFKGILICCTNLLGYLDPAVMRRFPWKIEFKPLTKAGRVKVFNSFFPSELVAVEKQRLAAIGDLTPGDIKAVWQKFRFVKTGELDHGMVVESLENEVKYKDGALGEIGFGA